MTKFKYVYESLREEIIEGELRPGERLVFNSLAKRFGVSPIPVREAVRQLESEGLVELLPHTKVMVKGFPVEHGVWTFELRAELEPLALEQATPFVCHDLLARLAALLDRLADLAEPAEFDSFVAGYVEFHDRLFELTPNRRLIEMIEELRAVSRRFHRLYRCRDVLQNSEADLRGILAALRSGDPQAVHELARKHRLAALQHIRAVGAAEMAFTSAVC
ncbi:MAG TPA: GntR family transcriptional regulator [Trueperaceae bacterium]|nr:GntR family transcriptional regulator [Trueperaceae bacterium]